MLQTDLKAIPQLVMILLGIITVLAFIYKPAAPNTTLLFYLITSIMLYSAIFSVSENIIDLLYPDRGWILHEGEKKRVMDMSWVWSVAAGLILSPLSLVLYHRSKLRNPRLEKGVSVLFLAMTLVIYIVWELG